MKNQYIVIGSNVVDGLTFWGPFTTHDDAVTWCEEQGHDFGDWTIAEVNAPEGQS